MRQIASSLIVPVKTERSDLISILLYGNFSKNITPVEILYLAHPVLRAHRPLTIIYNALGNYGKSNRLRTNQNARNVFDL